MKISISFSFFVNCYTELEIIFKCSDQCGEKSEKASFKELSTWGVFRPLAVDAAIINGKVSSGQDIFIDIEVVGR